MNKYNLQTELEVSELFKLKLTSRNVCFPHVAHNSYQCRCETNKPNNKLYENDWQSSPPVILWVIRFLLVADPQIWWKQLLYVVSPQVCLSFV